MSRLGIRLVGLTALVLVGVCSIGKSGGQPDNDVSARDPSPPHPMRRICQDQGARVGIGDVAPEAVAALRVAIADPVGSGLVERSSVERMRQFCAETGMHRALLLGVGKILIPTSDLGPAAGDIRERSRVLLDVLRLQMLCTDLADVPGASIPSPVAASQADLAGYELSRLSRSIDAYGNDVTELSADVRESMECVRSAIGFGVSWRAISRSLAAAGREQRSGRQCGNCAFCALPPGRLASAGRAGDDLDVHALDRTRDAIDSVIRRGSSGRWSVCKWQVEVSLELERRGVRCPVMTRWSARSADLGRRVVVHHAAWLAAVGGDVGVRDAAAWYRDVMGEDAQFDVVRDLVTVRAANVSASVRRAHQR